jgi:hypothetical protein
MYQEIKTDSLAVIFKAIDAALSEEPLSIPLSVSLNKRDDGYEATLVRALEPPTS